MSESEPVARMPVGTTDHAALVRLKELFSNVVELPEPERATFLHNVSDTGTSAALRRLLHADRMLAGMTTRSAVPRSSAVNADEEAPPASVGGFVIQRVLGRGGMGTVYLAERAVPGGLQRIALKCLHPIGAAAEFERRFHSEISVLAQLSHPRIARLIDAGQEADGRCWIAMEFIEGVPLLQYCDERNLPVPARLALFDTLCDAVSAAHRNLVVHRDLKSNNVLVREDGALFLLDFGIARPLTTVDNVTQPEQRFISPLNAAPEQIRGEPTTTACDVYGLGVILYELLCGVPPVEPGNRSADALREAVFNQVPLLASSRLRQLSRTQPARAQDITRQRSCADVARLARVVHGDLEQVCAVALRKQPHERYASVDQLREDLNRATTGQPILARGNDRLYRATRWLQRHVIALVIATAALVALVGGVTVLWQQANTLEQERDHARAQTRLAQQQGQRAEFLSSFLLDAFEQADPSHTMGAKLTAKDILDAGVRRLQSADETDPESRIRIAITLADVEYRLGLFAGADQLVTFSRERLAALPAPPPRLVAYQHYVEAKREWHNSQWANTLRETEAGLAALKVVDDASSERLWLGLMSLRADAHYGIDDYAGMFVLYRELVASIGTLHWIRPADAWGLRIWLAYALRESVDTRLEAISILKEVLQEQSAAHADNTPINALALRTLASVELDSGNAAEALRYAQKSLHIYQQAYGNGSPIVGRGLYSVAAAESSAGHPNSAIQHYQQALRILKTSGPPNDLSVEVLYNLGSVYDEELHDYPNAERYYRAATAGLRDINGADHSTTGLAEASFAYMLIKQQRYAEADPLLAHAMHCLEKFAVLHPEIISSIQAATAIVRHAQGNDAEARRLLRTALPPLRKYAPPNNYVLQRALTLAKRLQVREPSPDQCCESHLSAALPPRQ